MASPNFSAYQTYQKNKYETASPHRLTLMLYNGAVQFSTKAKQAIEQNNIADTNHYVQRAQNIVYELISSLDTKQGGELARNLKSLYFYIIDRLMEANIKKLTSPLDEVIGMLEELKSAWEEIGKRGTLGN